MLIELSSVTDMLLLLLLLVPPFILLDRYFDPLLVGRAVKVIGQPELTNDGLDRSELEFALLVHLQAEVTTITITITHIHTRRGKPNWSDANGERGRTCPSRQRELVDARRQAHIALREYDGVGGPRSISDIVGVLYIV
jgi:hypothetical protein